MSIRHEVGSATATVRGFLEPPDEVSLNAIPADATGLNYCGPRSYTFNPSTGLTSIMQPSPDPTMVSFNSALSSLEFTVSTSNTGNYGVYDASVLITLDQYTNFSGESHTVEI